MALLMYVTWKVVYIRTECHGQDKHDSNDTVHIISISEILFLNVDITSHFLKVSEVLSAPYAGLLQLSLHQMKEISFFHVHESVPTKPTLLLFKYMPKVKFTQLDTQLLGISFCHYFSCPC